MTDSSYAVRFLFIAGITTELSPGMPLTRLKLGGLLHWWNCVREN